MQPVYIVTAFVSHIVKTVDESPSTKFQFESGALFNEELITNRVIKAAKRRLLDLGYAAHVNQIGYRNANISNRVFSGAISIGGNHGVTVGGQEAGTAILYVSKKLLSSTSNPQPSADEKKEIPNEFIKYILDEVSEEPAGSFEYISGETYDNFFTPTNDDLKECQKYFKKNGFLACIRVSKENKEKSRFILIKLNT